MTKLPFKRLALAVGVASTILLAGCSSEDADPTPVSSTPLPIDGVVSGIINGNISIGGGLFLDDISFEGTAPTYALFSPLEGLIPLPTDLLFAAASATDGTASTDPGNQVTNAINDLDGWSTNAQLDIKFNANLDPASVKGPGSPGQNVFLIVLDTDKASTPYVDDALDPANIDGIDVAATTALQGNYTVATISVDGGENNAIRISPTSPLLAKRKYLAFVSNVLSPVLDTDGAPVGASISYSYYGDLSLPALTGQTAGIQQLVQGLEQVASCFLNVAGGGDLCLGGATTGAIPLAAARSSLVITNSFTTTDPTTVLTAMATPFGAMTQAGVPAATAANLIHTGAIGEIPVPRNRTIGFYDTDITLAGAPEVDGQIKGTDIKVFLDPTNSNPAVLTGQAYVYQGYITVPYFTDAPANTGELDKILTGTWSTNTGLANFLTDLSDDATVNGSKSYPSDDDGSFNVTYRMPFAQKVEDVTIPVLLVLPEQNDPETGLASEGYKTAIFVHGITGDRTNALPVAYALAANANVATIAIDLPTHGVAPATSAGANSAYATFNVDHGSFSAVAAAASAGIGERHFDAARLLDGTPVAMPTTATANPVDGSVDYRSGRHFINLTSFGTTRDNMRQAVVDLLNLNASLAAIDIDGDDTPDLDSGSVHLVGHSLGSILGSVFVAINNSEDVQTASQGLSFLTTSTDYQLPYVVSASLFAPGGQLTKVIENSPAFAPEVLIGLASSGVPQGSSDFDKFMYVLQSTIDSADPVNFVSKFQFDDGTSGTALLVQEIAGTPPFSSLIPDVVVPVEATGTYDLFYETAILNRLIALGFGSLGYESVPAPLAGTEPLLMLAHIKADTDPGVINGAPVQATVRFLAGHHSSLLYPSVNGPGQTATAAENLVWQDSLTQIIGLISTDGATLPVGTFGAGAAASVIK